MKIEQEQSLSITERELRAKHEEESREHEQRRSLHYSKLGSAFKHNHLLDARRRQSTNHTN